MSKKVKTQIKALLENKKIGKMSFGVTIQTLRFDSRKYGCQECFDYIDPIYQELYVKNHESIFCEPTPSFIETRIKELFKFLNSLA